MKDNFYSLELNGTRWEVPNRYTSLTQVTILQAHANLLTYMRVLILRCVRVGDPTAHLADMYDTSPESQARGAVYRLLFISIDIISGEYKANATWLCYKGN